MKVCTFHHALTSIVPAHRLAFLKNPALLVNMIELAIAAGILEKSAVKHH
jgi:hypothetical protein